MLSLRLASRLYTSPSRSRTADIGRFRIGALQPQDIRQKLVIATYASLKRLLPRKLPNVWPTKSSISLYAEESNTLQSSFVGIKNDDITEDFLFLH